MILNAIGICSRALTKLGAKTISSFSENSTEATVVNQLYDTTVNALLSSYPWRFALAQKKLARLNLSPAADFRFSYALPNDCIRIISAGQTTRGSGLNYRVFNNQLHANAEQVILTYITRPTEDKFPAFFIQAVVAKLAAVFCLPLTESTARTDYLKKEADAEIAHARLIDSHQAVPTCFQDFSLIEVRQ